MKTLVHAGAAMLVAALVATTALAAAPNRAKAIALKPADFPGGAAAKNASADANASLSGYAVTYRYREFGRPYELSVSVVVFKNRALAVQMYKELKADVTAVSPKLQLEAPPFGDEQVASHAVLGGGSQLFVRKGAVVWYLEPQTYMVRGGKTYELSRAQTIALYQKYGRKQQRRVALYQKYGRKQQRRVG